MPGLALVKIVETASGTLQGPVAGMMLATSTSRQRFQKRKTLVVTWHRPGGPLEPGGSGPADEEPDEVEHSLL